ncbi:BTB/POZ domain containing protein [Lasiodiplodia theobromae]|uniref:BTB/POZ domain containing protein n=1 Tax=Lasiodiplodia theobromae TaxID=45133 RepID=UPI0015C3C74F|nr:BTB/POZ domain containing protein [Lasiodiplodia theobromae]KAF4544999.1 BTB/POZ domain containing protein [Lasiodiplodia theobromae]
MASTNRITDDLPASESQVADSVDELTQLDPPIIEIAPRGDVVFVLGGSEMKLKVSSEVMTLASPAFHAMFRPDRPWTEAQNLSEDQPKEVSLPDDHPEAMKLICEVLHHQHDAHKAEYPEWKLVAHVSRLTNKYFLQKALSYASEQWLTYHVDRVRKNHYTDAEAEELLATAYLFSFKEIASMPEAPIHTVPLMLEEQRNYLKNEMNKLIQRQVSSWLSRRATFSNGCTTGTCTAILYRILMVKAMWREDFESAFFILTFWSTKASPSPCLALPSNILEYCADFVSYEYDTMGQGDGDNGKGGQRAAKRQRTDVESASLSPKRGNPVDDTAKPITNLAPNGDIVLVFSDHSRLRVHSVVLELASLVFEAMFSPHFSEGRNLGVLLRDIVTLVDKYGLVAATRLQIRSFLEEQIEEAKRSRFRGNFDEELLAMSYMLKDEKAFNLISRELIVFHGRSFGTLNDPFNILPSRVLVALEEHRNAARKDLNLIITQALTSWFQSFDTMSQCCKRPHDDCAMELLLAFLANRHDILNRDKEDFIAHKFDYWMDPGRENREFSQDTFTDLYDDWIPGYVCSRCRIGTQIKQVLCLSLHLAAEAGYNKIPGLHLRSFRD